MRKYIKYIEMGFMDGLYYRTSSIMTFLSSFLIDYVKIAVWYGALALAYKRTNGVMLNDTVTYMIIATAFSAIYRTQPNDTLSDAYIRGQLVHRFVYPVSIIASNFCEIMGKVLSRLIINVLPTILILNWVYRPEWNIEYDRLAIVLINIFIGLYMNYIMFTFVDVLCFWMKDTRLLQKVRDLFLKFFSGALMPLWFLDEKMAKISESLPFEKQIYSPVSYSLGLTIKSVYIRDLIILIMYSVVFSMLTFALWYRGIKRVESFGG